MKRSKIISGVLLSVLVLIVLAYSFYVKANLEEVTAGNVQIWLKGEGPYFEDTLSVHYSFLSSDFPIVELDPLRDSYVRIEGYENAREFVKIFVSNDTLNVKYHKIKKDTIIVALEGEYPLKVTVGSRNLAGITLKNDGKIDHPVRPFGSDVNGVPVYDPGQWNKYVLRNRHMSIALINGASANFLLDTGHLDLRIENELESPSNPRSLFSSGIQLNGRTNKLTLLDLRGFVSFAGRGFTAEDVEISDLAKSDLPTSGQIEFRCTGHLKVHLSHALDVYYSGDPEVEKIERGYGRVMKVR